MVSRFAWVLAPLGCACSGQIAPGGGDAGSDASADSSSGPYILPSLTDSCDGDSALTGQNVLAIMRPVYAGLLMPTTGTPTAYQLFLSVTNSPTITCHPHIVSTGGPPDVPASVSIAVKAQFATQDMTFAESFAATVSLSAGTNSQSLAFAGTEPVSAIQGTFKPAITGTWMTHDLSYGGTLLSTMPDGGPGTSNGTITEQASNGNMGQVRGVGSWK